MSSAGVASLEAIEEVFSIYYTGAPFLPLSHGPILSCCLFSFLSFQKAALLLF